MIRRLASTAAVFAVLLAAGAVQAQPYQGEPDPYALPPDYDQVQGYGDQPGYADEYEGPARYDEPGQPGYPPEYEGPASYDEEEASPAEDYARDDRGYAPAPRYDRRDDSHYNSGASVRADSTYSRRDYSRSGSSYSSRSAASSQEAYVQGEYAEDDRYGRDERDGGRAYVGAPVYVDEDGVSRTDEGYSRERRYSTGGGVSAEQTSGARTASTYSSSGGARFGYQRRFYAYSVAEEQSEVTSVRRSEEFAYLRRDRAYGWDEHDLRLDNSFTGGLNGGVEGEGPVVWSSGGGGYASFSASASSFAGARAFARARGGRGHRGRGHGCGCR